MNQLRWIERVSRKLLFQGLPQGYVRRVVGELRDHHSELLATQTPAQGAAHSDTVALRLGNPTKLAGAIAGEFRRQHFSGRHPWLSFVAAPILLMIAGWSLLVFSLIASGWLCENVLGVSLNEWIAQRPAEAQAAMHIWQNVVLFGTPAVVALLICRWAGRSAVSRNWLIAACAITALLAFAMQVEVALPTAPGNGRLTMGLGLTIGVLRMMVPMVVALWAASKMPAHWTDSARTDDPPADLRRAA